VAAAWGRRSAGGWTWGEPAPAPPDPGAWGPDWIVLPIGRGVHRADLRPCGTCGERTFYLTRRREPAVRADTGVEYLREEGRVCCPRCCRPLPGEVATLLFDTATGTLRRR
jgi:hypothetical protein